MTEPTPADLLGPITAYQESALIATAVETGVADALAGGATAVEEVAARTGADRRGTQALLSGLVATGLAERRSDGYVLSPRGALLASSHPRSVASIVRKEWFFYRVWAELPQAVRDGHARIDTWRRRLEADPATSLEFLRALDDLAALFGTELAELAGPAPAACSTWAAAPAPTPRRCSPSTRGCRQRCSIWRRWSRWSASAIPSSASSLAISSAAASASPRIGPGTWCCSPTSSTTTQPSAAAPGPRGGALLRPGGS